MRTGTREVRTVMIVAGEKFELKHVHSRDGVTFVKVANGPGPRLARAGMQAVPERVDAVVSTGLCGAVVPNLRVGDIVVATEVNGQPAELPRCVGPFHAGKVASADRVIGTAAERRQLAGSGIQAVDMESQAAQDEARRRGVPFYCVRAVSDEAGEDWTLDLNAARGDDGAFRIGRILRQAAARPAKVVPELLRLRRNSALAARKLGDFLAKCDF